MHKNTTSNAPFRDWAKRVVDRIECLLDTALSIPDDDPGGMVVAMRYAVLDGGKRLRPMLCYAAAEAVGAPPDAADAAACAVELVHGYSLVHDDMPMMDNDALRRGKPSVHVKFGEASALLVGDGLQSMSFDMIASSALPAGVVVGQMRTLSGAIGINGMVGGQALDLGNCNRSLSHGDLERLHNMKTGALIRAAVVTGGLCNETADAEAISALEQYANHLGLAFQIVDDILDVTSGKEILGKTPGKDASLNKTTFVSLFGLEKARAMAGLTIGKAVAAVAPFGNNALRLQQLAELVGNRDR